MRTILLSFVLSCALHEIVAQDLVQVPKPCGFINLPDFKRVILEGQAGARWMLGEGQRVNELEVLQILPESGAVKLNFHGQQSVLVTNAAPALGSAGSGIALENANLESIMILLGELSDRTILHPALPAEDSLSLKALVKQQSEAANAVQQALANQGLAIIADGSKFLWVIPAQLKATARPRSSDIRSAPSSGSQTAVLPPGLISFRNASIRQVLPIYAELSGRKLDAEQSLPATTGASITLINQTPWTREECLYALDRVLEWAGVKIVFEGADRLKPVPMPQASVTGKPRNP